jgi:Sulfotransferase domain
MDPVREKAIGGRSPEASDGGRVKVLCVLGWGRSGSTLVGRIVGQTEGFFLVGELRYIWDRGLIENRLCSCGTPFTECPVWRKIVSRMLEEGNRVSATRMVELRERGLHTRHVLLSPTREELRSRVARMGEYTEALESLYRAAQDVSGSRVIVDTSKFPSYGYILQSTPGIDLYVLHLVRDPRAVAYSWASRQKPKPDHGKGAGKRFMTPHGLFESALVWNAWNLSIERIWRRNPQRYMLLRYEDFVKSPRSAVRNILSFLGEEEAKLPFLNEREVLLDAPHTFSGNPDRFQSGVVEITPDQRWRRKMGVVQKAAVTALTWPGLLSYGYPLRTS